MFPLCCLATEWCNIGEVCCKKTLSVMIGEWCNMCEWGGYTWQWKGIVLMIDDWDWYHEVRIHGEHWSIGAKSLALCVSSFWISNLVQKANFFCFGRLCSLFHWILCWILCWIDGKIQVSGFHSVLFGILISVCHVQNEKIIHPSCCWNVFFHVQSDCVQRGKNRLSCCHIVIFGHFWHNFFVSKVEPAFVKHETLTIFVLSHKNLTVQHSGKKIFSQVWCWK